MKRIAFFNAATNVFAFTSCPDDMVALQTNPYATGSLVVPDGFLLDLLRCRVSAGVLVLRNDLPPDVPNPPPGPPTLAQIRRVRDDWLESTLWAVQGDTPLTNQSRNAVNAWRGQLETWTINHPGVYPPEPPVFVYKT